ncbi:MAG TPA: glycerol-3-phosphate 1-O-acyltransferase PlsY [Nitrospinota bacterium]|nr:glycerol-3-phosphate 1-O-acyltransferase PlsY [Nitrospinota bacterium]|tara:strand:- start:317610 stop:318224 length:615 start_codon:yes stop_codon:yes gene_type:complete
MSWVIVAVVASYLIGSIPTALIVGRIVGGVDIRQHGSGNAGATNIYRLYGMKPYLLTLSIDVFKGFVAVAFLSKLSFGVIWNPQTIELICGAAVIAGHIWTLFAGFRGGKGVATAAGVLIGILPVVALIAVSIYLFITLTTGYVSLGSILAALSTPLSMYFLHGGNPPEVFIVLVALAVLIVFTHRSNIIRLLKGEEVKTNFLK